MYEERSNKETCEAGNDVMKAATSFKVKRNASSERHFVLIFTEHKHSCEVLKYALFDTQSDIIFIYEDTLAA
jgi:hypothetical protein